MADKEVDANHVLSSVKATVSREDADPYIVLIKTDYDPLFRILTI